MTSRGRVEISPLRTTLYRAGIINQGFRFAIGKSPGTDVMRGLALLFLFVSTVFVAHSMAQEPWRKLATENFTFIGDAPEPEIRSIAVGLEQFRAAIGPAAAAAKGSGKPTTVFVFRSPAALASFKPSRRDGTVDELVGGYFISGDEANYIVVASATAEAPGLGVIFHEYVHYHLNRELAGKEVPAWYGEGLAEYYQTFTVDGPGRARIGSPQAGHIQLLRRSSLVPLETLFRTTNRELRSLPNDRRMLFYAESWALAHMLKTTGRGNAMASFAKAAAAVGELEKVFKTAFGVSIPALQKDLEDYIGRGDFTSSTIPFRPSTADGPLPVQPMPRSDVDAYLGDLLVQIDRPADAERYLRSALSVSPGHPLANSSLGLARLRAERFAEAKPLLERASAAPSASAPTLYRYAYLLSRDARYEAGLAVDLPVSIASRMRSLLSRAEAADRDFSDSYDLLAFVALVTDSRLDEAAAGIERALRLKPENDRYRIRQAEILARGRNLVDAAAIARTMRSSSDADVKERATSLLLFLSRQKLPAQTEAGPAAGSRKLSDEHESDLQKWVALRTVNEALRKPSTGEARLLGRIRSVRCSFGSVRYTVTSDERALEMTGHDFAGLYLRVLSGPGSRAVVGCEADLSAFNAVVSFRPASTRSGLPELFAVEFVSDDFRLMSAEELALPLPDLGLTYEERPESHEMRAERERSILRSLKDSLRRPGPGETRNLGYLERIDCTADGRFFYMRTDDTTYRLRADEPEIRLLTPALSNAEFGCGVKPISVPAVFVHTAGRAQGNGEGEILSLEFVPRNLKLD